MKYTLTGFTDEIDSNLINQIEFAKSLGINYMEIRGVNGKSIVEYSIDGVKEIKKQLDKNNFKVSSIGSPIGKIKIIDEFEPHLKLFEHTIQIAKIMETKYIRMFSFYIPENHKPEDYRDEVIKRLKILIDIAKKHNIVLCHENEKDIYGDTVGRCLDLMKMLYCENFKAVFDPANFVQCGEEVYPKAYNTLKEYIEYVHIKDANFEDKRNVVPGTGNGQIFEVLKSLLTSGYSNFLSIEPHLTKFFGFSKLENGDEKIEKEDDGPKQFKIATNALKEILDTIEQEI